MLANYLAAALRNLVRNKLYAGINLIGLAVGFASALLIMLFVRDELTYDTWVPGHENIYRLAMNGQMRGSAGVYTDGTHPSNAQMLREGIPDIERVARLLPEKRGVRGSVFESNDTIVWADAEFLEMFPVSALAGDPVSALRQVDQAVVTRSFALRYFGRDNVIGEILDLDRKLSLRIAAVVADFPSRSHLSINAMISSVSSASPLAAVQCCSVSIDGALTYVQIKPGALSAVTNRFPALIDQHIPGDRYGPNGEFTKASYAYAFELIPLAALHTLSWSGRYIPSHHGVLKPPGEPALVPAFLTTGALIFLVAIVNVFALMSARANRRMTEVAARKVSGAPRLQLVAQFMGETALYVALSLLFALAAVKVALPGVNGFLGRTITMSLADPLLSAAIAMLVAVAVLVGGLYPAVVLSRLRPVDAMKPGSRTQGGAGFLRYAFVLSQFAVLIALIVAVVTIDRQTRFAMKEGLRFDTDQLLVIDPPCNAAIKARMAAASGVRGVACAGPGLLTGSEMVSLTTLPDGRQFPLNFIGVDPGFLEMIGIKPIAGRLLRPDEVAPADALGGTILNETAVRAFGFASAEEAIGKHADRQNEVIGVVPDFPLRSLRDAPMPTAFIQTRDVPRARPITIVKLAGDQVPEALREIDAAWDTLATGRPTPRRFYDQFVQAQYTDLVRQSQAFRALSITAVVLAALGLFGLAAFTAEQRTKEIGVRKSMGASSGDILRMLLWQFTAPVIYANAIAWPLAYFAMMYWLEGFAYHIDLEPWIFLAASGAALAIAVCTVSGHAWLVARTQPVKALRYE
ncbi:MAG: ABC transporter permease [Rhodospirillaceae bacterium]|nr:ABC transporter permease [Rhodospirillaceae bacterium]